MRLSAVIGALALALASGSPSAAQPNVEVRTLVGEAPSWFTPDFAQDVIDAGSSGVTLPEEATVRTSSLAFLGIRPGQQMIITDSPELTSASRFALCTSNFVFGSPGSYTIGTAGHCGDVGDKVFMVFAPLGVAYIGNILSSTYSEDHLAPDFALVSIGSALQQWVSPSMAHWGGPTGAYTGDDITPVVHSGHGLVVGTGGTPRAGVAYQWGEEWRFEGVVVNGDSGSAANVVGGLAAGNITHIAVNTGDTVPAWMGGTSISRILTLVGGRALATCSTPIPWPAPGCPPL